MAQIAPISLTQTFNRILFYVCNGRDFGVQKIKNGDRGRIVFYATLNQQLPVRVKNKEMSVQLRIHVPRWTYFGQERDLCGCLKLVGCEDKSGNFCCCCRIKGLVVESSGNTPPNSQVALLVFSCLQKSHERA